MWKPKWSEPCPCASGKKVKDCCWQRLPGFDIGKVYTRALRDKQLERALLAARASASMTSMAVTDRQARMTGHTRLQVSTPGKGI
jgi:hypothetical protein